MERKVYIQLTFLCVVNIIFTFLGIVLNTLVMASILKLSQLRKKLCHFMIIVLSTFDLVSVVTNYPGILLHLISSLREDYDSLATCTTYLDFANLFMAFPFYVLIVMSIERYLGAYYPIFHRTSVTKRRLLTLLAILLIFQTIFYVISIYDFIISRTLCVIIFMTTVFPSLVCLNFKLFQISNKVRRRKAKPPEKGTRVNLKSISSCLLVVACLVILSIPSSVYIVFNMHTENKQASSARLSRIWAATFFGMNCTLNSLVFFWKNKVLRTEGIKILQTLKDRLVYIYSSTVNIHA